MENVGVVIVEFVSPPFVILLDCLGNMSCGLVSYIHSDAALFY